MTDAKQLSKYDLFLSYCHRDTKVVTKIAHALREKGLDIFLDVWEVKLGDVLVQTIESALTSSKAGIVFFSLESVKSKWVRTEYNRMLNQAIGGDTFRLIPVRLDDCKIPEFAQDRLWLDLFNDSDEEINNAINKIISSLNLQVKSGKGSFWSGATELADRLKRISKSLSLGSEKHVEFSEIMSILQLEGVGLREHGTCECGGQLLCGHIDLGAVDYYDNFFHICTRCLYHVHTEKYSMNGSESEWDTVCPYCSYRW